MNTTAHESPLLFPPTDAELRRRLQAKLVEYQSRKDGKGEAWEYWHPEQAHMMSEGYRDACYKVDVLTAVLNAPEGRPVRTFDLSQELAKRYGQMFDPQKFSNACAVIASYLDPTASEARGGTGLPK